MAVMLIPELFILYPEPDTAPTFKSSDPGKRSGSGSDPNYFKHDRKFYENGLYSIKKKNRPTAINLMEHSIVFSVQLKQKKAK